MSKIIKVIPGSKPRGDRAPTVISVEAERWTSLDRRISPEDRKAAIRQISAKKSR
jgi:hypothetical protein